MTAIDVFTKYLFAAPLRRVTSQAVAHVLTQIFLRHTYIPKIIVTDEGTQFTSKLMKDVTNLLDIELSHATVKHPQSIGLLERAHAGLKKTLKIYENSNHTDWHKYLDYAVFAHNTNYDPQTKTTPSDLFHSFAPNKALETRFQVPHRKEPEFQTTQQIQDKLRELHKQQKHNIIERYILYKHYYDAQAQAHPLKEHSYCLLLNPKLDTQKQSMHKMLPKWLALYRVEQKLSNENYLIREVGTNHTQIVHRIRLRSYSPRHTIHDLQTIDKKNFIVDPKFPDEYRQPAIFDNAQQQILWHPIMSVNPETDEVEIEPIKKSYGTLFSREPRVHITRIQLPSKPQTKPSQTVPQKAAVQNRITPKVADSSTKIQRILKPIPATQTAPRAGATQVVLPKQQSQQSAKSTVSSAAKLKEKTQRVLPRTLQKFLRLQTKSRKGEQKTSTVSMLQVQEALHTPMGELAAIPEESENVPTPTSSDTNYNDEDPIIQWEDLPPPDWNEYDNQTQENSRNCYYSHSHQKYQGLEDSENLIKKNLDHTHVRIGSRLPCEKTPPEVPTKVLHREDHGADPITILRWHWVEMPLDTESIPENDIIVKLTTKEKFTKFNHARKNKDDSTHTGTPEIGDARRFFESSTQRYITALILSSRDTHLNMENLQLALWNLHCQMNTLNAKNAHLQPALRAFKPLEQMQAFLAIEKQFMNTDIRFHIWIPDRKNRKN